MKKILIAYATKTNTTKEISEEIGRILEEKGIEVDIQPLRNASNFDNYSGVIIGAPINGMKWVTEAVQFVEKNQEILKSMPTALFYVAYFHGLSRKFSQNMMKKSVNSMKELISSSQVGMFAGRVEEEPPGFLRVIFGAPKGLPLDRRDWDKIRNWAETIVLNC